MAMSKGQKVGLIAALGIGGFLLAGGGGSSAKAATPVTPVDPCIDPKDCATLTKCATKAMVGATKADVPKLQGMKATADKLGCTDLSKTLGNLITALTTTTKTTTVPGSVFTVSGIKDRQQLVNKAWTLARMGISGPGLAPASAEDVAKYHLASDGSFGDVSDALRYASDGKTAIVDVKTGEFISRSPFTIVNELQAAAGLIVDGKFGPESRKAWNWGLGNGSPSSIGGEESCEHEVAVGSECSACDVKHGRKLISNPESLGPYDTLVAHDEGYVKYDRAFGSNFGAGPSSGPLSSRNRAFGTKARFGA